MYLTLCARRSLEHDNVTVCKTQSLVPNNLYSSKRKQLIIILLLLIITIIVTHTKMYSKTLISASEENKRKNEGHVLESIIRNSLKGGDF